jgi:tellurite resistance protein TerC
MGLRSIFFALAGIIQLFHYLQYGLSIILIFVGMKMVLSNVYKMPVGIALGVVAGILAVSVLASILWPPKKIEVLPVEVDRRVRRF